MADDLDELLDEVELRFCQDRPAPSREGAGMEVKISAPLVPSKEISREEDDLSDLIDDIFHDDPSLSDSSKSRPGTITNCTGNGAFSQTRGKKCCPVYLGGSSAPLGLGTNTSRRNNMPDLNKLKVKTLSRKGTRAYACQCSWRSIQDLTDLREEQELRWVCGKH
ncbi:cilia- and flagella-associated protein 418 isoform X3 [Hemiscyllium ocellatum]|uniref:cilia- and flagella-associated protein 418 isoform X3 n=1 Tax=Hemiscyllium ocellatum TaxID=170820 RepID=UPI0029672C35|nr:cilia- and flagella-associated protein 418 isoform X3 [Hemiscyllium ocellatum]